MKSQDNNTRKYSLEELVIEFVRRGYMTIDEGKLCIIKGTFTEEIMTKITERMKMDPEADIRGSKRIDSEQEYMKQFLKIKFKVNPNVNN